MARTATRRRRTLQTLDGVVAQQIRTLRGDRSQQWLADRIGETQSTVARIESGKRSIAIRELFVISAALDVAPVELLAASFQPSDVPINGKRRLPPAEAREWLRGERPLPGGDERAYWENVSDDEVRVRREFSSAYLLRLLLSDYVKAALTGDAITMDAVLDTVGATVESDRRLLEQRHGSPAFYKAREERRGHAG